ncbi:restriction endonuclease subunit S, partial [Anoxybacillus flavithermus]|uniref:restriction endonuclease subunit S n=1 Tax=Anoxybacillus flavithermus TaxID=33934 RepID=UPI0007D91D8E
MVNSQTSSWQLKKLEDICEVRKGKFDPKKEPNTIYIGLEHIEQQTGRLLGTGDSGETTSIKSIFKTGDVLFGKLRPYLRKYWFATFDGVCATEILPLTPKKGIDSKFLFYIIQQDKFVDYLDQKSYGTKMPRTSWKEMAEYNINLPPLSEQRKIAAILSSVDEAIEKTEAIIEQTEKVKKGLMQQLLTKGIGHTKFKKSEIGEIPEEWEVKSIDELVFVNPESLSNKTNEEYEFEYIDIGSVERTGKIGETVRYQFKNSPSRARRIVRTGDTIISTVRPYLRAFAFIDNKHDQKVCSTGFAVLRPKEKIDPVFLFQSILNDKFVEFLKSRMTGSNYPAVTATDIKEYKLGVPRDINEQTKIAKILAKYDEKLEIEEKSLEQLQTIKKALMQVLLTGKVRVKVDDEVNNPMT